MEPQDLQFGDYSTNNSEKANAKSGDSTPAKIPVMGADPTNDDDAYSDDDDKANLLGSGGSRMKGARFWSFDYYQSFFDVETHHVLNRIYCSIVPSFRKNFIKNDLRPNPDLYGPFWIAATLVFAIAINGNLSSLIRSHSKGGFETNKWAYDLDKISTAGAIVSLYLSVVPTAVWLFLRWRKSVNMVSLLEIVCVYGYSLSVFIPASLLWLIPYHSVQWTVAIVGLAISSIALCLALWPSVEEENLPVSAGALIVVILLHSALVASFMVCIDKDHRLLSPQITPVSDSTDNMTSSSLNLAENNLFTPTAASPQTVQEKVLKTNSPTNLTVSSNGTQSKKLNSVNDAKDKNPSQNSKEFNSVFKPGGNLKTKK